MIDPDTVGRGLNAHRKTQTALASAVCARGGTPWSPKPSEPQYDVGWADGPEFWISEVKSLGDLNARQQLRTALGQVLDYRDALARVSGRAIHAVIALERKPPDLRHWQRVAASADILLSWRPKFATLPATFTDPPAEG